MIGLLSNTLLKYDIIIILGLTTLTNCKGAE